MILAQAQNPFLRSIQDALTEQTNESELGAFALGVIAFLVLVILAGRYLNPENRRRQNGPVDYLTVAVDMLGLTEQDRRDLLRIARIGKLETPAAMLLSPANFAAALNRPGVCDRDPDLQRRMGDLCKRLFDARLPRPAKS